MKTVILIVFYFMFYGKFARGESGCDPDPCQHGATCIQDMYNSALYSCRCVEHCEGTLCDTCNFPEVADNDSSGLADWELALIIVGSILFVAIILCIVIFCCSTKKGTVSSNL